VLQRCCHIANLPRDRAKRLKLEEQLERKERRIVNTFNGEIEKLIQNQDQNEATWQRNLGLALHHLDPKTFRNALRNSLYFEQMEERELTIPKAYQKTYEWIFNPSHNKDDCGFVNWLQSDDQNLYWITGKPGSGKSTLMKFIANHPRKNQLLSRWGGSMEVICFSFFFWNSGTDLQMSQEGLLRSIFSDALRANPELAEKVFPNHFERWTFSARIKDTWTWEDLIQSFERLLNELIKTYKIMLFIDGLDEFYGPHYKLIELLKNTIRPNIKICISSRPWYGSPS
jgi:hypothetical protein